jgi:hypothetical protein
MWLVLREQLQADYERRAEAQRLWEQRRGGIGEHGYFEQSSAHRSGAVGETEHAMLEAQHKERSAAAQKTYAYLYTSP